MVIRLVCTECKVTARAEIQEDKIPDGVSPMAAVLRVAHKQGFRYRNGRIGKSVVDVVCPLHIDPLYLSADHDPADVEPGTTEQDLALTSPEPSLG